MDGVSDLIKSIFSLTQQKNKLQKKKNEFFFSIFKIKLHVPDVVEFNKLININQDLSSKICNAIIENY